MRIQIERNGQQTWLNLPCTEQEMQNAEQEIGICDPTDTKVLLTGIDSGISELNVLVGKTHDLDHLNLLVRYIDGMCENECNQYRAALFITKATELKDIINLTQHTQNYSLITPTDTLESAGRNHYLDLHGCYTVGEEEKLNFTGLAAELLHPEKVSIPHTDWHSRTVSTVRNFSTARISPVIMTGSLCSDIRFATDTARNISSFRAMRTKSQRLCIVSVYRTCLSAG